jgi:hypothetical protein
MTDPLRELTRAEFESTFRQPMRNITQSADEVVEIWSHAERALEAAFAGAYSCDWNTAHVYESSDSAFQHISIPSTIRNVHLAVVINKPGKKVMGHYRLDLGALYGVGDAASQDV